MRTHRLAIAIAAASIGLFACSLVPSGQPARALQSHVLISDGAGFSITPDENTVYECAEGVVLDGQHSLAAAFKGEAPNVTIRNCTVENYNTALQRCAIDGRGSTGWLVEWNEVRNNSACGIEAGHYARVLNNHIHHNGQIGVKADNSVNALFEGNEIAFNNTKNINPGWEAGGSKFWGTSGLVVRNNYVHDNNGPGLWTDTNNRGTLYEGNRVENNARLGIFHEVSFDAMIYGNQVHGNGNAFDAWAWGAQIAIVNSSGVEVSGNTVSGPDGIVLIQQNRGTYKTHNNNVHGNTISHVQQSGAFVDHDSGGFLAGNNRFDGNTYYVPSKSGPHWEWLGHKTWDQIRLAGQEANGTLL